MKIAVDADVLANDRKTGVYYYNQKLFEALVGLDRSNDYSFAYFGQPHALDSIGLLTKNATAKNVSWFPRKLYNLSLRTPFGLPFDLVTGTEADLFIFTKFVRWPLWRRRQSMVFVYDTSFVDYPELIETWHFLRYLTWAVPRSLKQASHIIAISESTKYSLVKHYGTSEEKISVITPALDHDIFKPAEQTQIDQIKTKYQIQKPYILSVGTIEPRKNLVGLLRAFAEIPDKLRQKYTLVLAGGEGWLDTEINRLYNQLRQSMSIIRTGYVPSEDLPVLYSGASVFVYPSLFEGFGMPPLEAMACGAPVIAADNSSLPEVVGNAGVLIEAHNYAQLAQEIEKVLRNPKWAAELRQRGLERAKDFQWELSAQKLLTVINKVGAK